MSAVSDQSGRSGECPPVSSENVWSSWLTERAVRIHCFENVTAILFLVAISEYDQMLYEDESINRMQEALVLFDSICNSRWFVRTSIILFLNKVSLVLPSALETLCSRRVLNPPSDRPVPGETPPFADRRLLPRLHRRVRPANRGRPLLDPPRSPPTSAPDSPGGSDLQAACDYFSSRFVSLNQSTAKQIYVHFTCATETQQIRFVLSAVNDIIIQLNLRDCGLL